MSYDHWKTTEPDYDSGNYPPSEDEEPDADPCFLLKVIFTPDGLKRTAGTLTGAMYATPEDAMDASGCTVWTRNMFGDKAGEWRSDDGEWIVRRAST